MFRQMLLFCVHKNVWFYVQHCHMSDSENQVRYFIIGDEK